MIYKPQTGCFKDNFLLYENGTYYLFSMFLKDAAGNRDETGYRNVFLATSKDSVHWKDHGRVIADAPFPVWAMMVYKVGDFYVMNHGSFGQEGMQNVIKLWKSNDLYHWEYMGEEYDVYPDYSQCEKNSRLDCMYVIREEDGYYGFATGPQWLFKSEDGVHWKSLPTPKIEWGEFPPSPMSSEEGIFEVAGCEKIGGKYYLIGGWFNYMGYSGYADYVLTADRAEGPFRPCSPKYRLNGQSERWVCLWARYLRSPDGLLVSNYMIDGYSYECGTTWLPPLKKVDCDGKSISLKYWNGNEKLKGERIDFPMQEMKPIAMLEKCGTHWGEDCLEMETDKQYSSLCKIKTEYYGVYFPTKEIENGIVVEGKIKAESRSPREIGSGAGFYFPETEKSGTAVLLTTYGTMRIGEMKEAGGKILFAAEDEAHTGICSTATGLTGKKEQAFRLIMRKNMFEIYLDDVLVQTFNTTHEYPLIGQTPFGIGFLAENGKAIFSDIKIWKMSV